jgi:hypothetical protein
MVETTATSSREISSEIGSEYGATPPLATYRRPARERPRELPAEYVERTRALIDQVAGVWSPSEPVDVEEMLRQA